MPVSLAGREARLAFGQNVVLREFDIDLPAASTVAMIGPSDRHTSARNFFSPALIANGKRFSGGASGQTDRLL